MDLFEEYNKQEDEAHFFELPPFLTNFAEAGACCDCCYLWCYNGCGNCCTCYGVFPCCVQ